MRLWILTAAAAACLIAGSIVHGRWTGRWTPRVDPAVIAAALDRVPLKIGDWEGVAADDEDRSTWRDEMDLGILRKYKNVATNQTVLVMLRGGAPGPIGLHHTPASCYHAVGFADSGTVERRPFAIADGSSQTLWVSDFRKAMGSEVIHARVYWGYAGEPTWVAPDRARVAMADYRVCYKLYVVRGAAKSDEPKDGDLCESFLKVALPQINTALFGS